MLKQVEVETLEQFQSVRAIRNSVREYMTGYNQFINPEEQIAWRDKFDRSRNKLYLFYENGTEALVGFGFLRLVGTQWYATLAVLEEFRGRKYGTEIYKRLVNQSTEDVWLEIFSDNNPSLRAALAANFKITDISDKVIHLVYRKENN